MKKLILDLAYAKEAVKWLIENESGNVDFHGLTYWASEVERLREEIRRAL